MDSLVKQQRSLSFLRQNESHCLWEGHSVFDLAYGVEYHRDLAPDEVRTVRFPLPMCLEERGRASLQRPQCRFPLASGVKERRKFPHWRSQLVQTGVA